MTINNQRRWIAGFLPVVLVVTGARLAMAGTDPIEIKVDDIGTIKAMVGGTSAELAGSFTVTKKSDDNTTMSLQQLEKFLGINPLNEQIPHLAAIAVLRQLLATR